MARPAREKSVEGERYPRRERSEGSCRNLSIDESASEVGLANRSFWQGASIRYLAGVEELSTRNQDVWQKITDHMKKRGEKQRGPIRRMAAR